MLTAWCILGNQENVSVQQSDCGQTEVLENVLNIFCVVVAVVVVVVFSVDEK